MRRALPWVLLASAAWLFFSDYHPAETVDHGTVAPGLTAAVYEGEPFDLATARGEVVVLNFWATWCPPCRAEAPALARIHQRLGDRGTVVGIVGDPGDMAVLAATGHELGMTYPIARAPEEAWGAYRVTQLPTTYVIDPDGNIAWSHVGAVPEDELADVVDELVASAP